MSTRRQWLLGLVLACACVAVFAQVPAPGCGAANDWVQVPGGVLQQPSGPVRIEAFYLDATEVTNVRFAAFVAATGYQSTAERLAPDTGGAWGSAVFRAPTLGAPNWWALRPAAHWAQPQGEGEAPLDPQRPVVHMSYEDASAFARWAGGRLPTEAEWEYAARAGQSGELPRPTSDAANSWQGLFPFNDRGDDGFKGSAPVACYPPNAFGLHDMVGNVWEWVARDETRMRPGMGLLAGGSFLCADNFCRNDSVAGRQVQELDFSANHIGFRVRYASPPAEER